jgi:hypothetical protein
MREIIFKCDRCKKVVIKPVRLEAWFVNHIGSLTDKAYIFNGEESNELDLCEGCAKALNDFIYPPEEEAEEIPEQDPEEDEDPFVPKKLTDKLKKDLVKEKKPHPTKKKIDIGKIRALRDAGWSLKKIAEEMGVASPQTIANHLKEVET